jgi:hypothetical protein
VYQYNHARDNSSKSRLGQAHRWYFLKLTDAVDIDLNKATEYEASDFKWLPFAEVLEATDDFKKHVYQELATYFSDVILKK